MTRAAMTAAERRQYDEIHRRVAGLNPLIAAAVLRAFALLRDGISEADVARAMETGLVERLFQDVLGVAVLTAAYLPVRERIRQGVIQAVRYVTTNPPSTVRVVFDTLNPRVLDAIRALETRVITDLETSLAQTVKLAVEQGIRDGLNPRAVAVELRSVIGLGPTQWQEVQNFRDALLGQNGRTLSSYTLRGRIAKGPLSAEQVDRYVAAYTKRRIALNAETTARTAALDAQKLGQRLAWQDAIDKGLVDGGRLMKKWIGVMDDRERPTHVAMQGVAVPFDQPWDVPDAGEQMVPGESEYNCRCIARYYQAAA